MDNFTLAYIEAALWSSTDDEGEPIDARFSLDDIAPETLQAIKADCAKFQKQCRKFFKLAHWKGRSCEGSVTEKAGHDFWLTRNGHGAGFWDGDWSEPAERAMDKLSREFGEFNLYVGDDGQLHHH